MEAKGESGVEHLMRQKEKKKKKPSNLEISVHQSYLSTRRNTFLDKQKGRNLLPVALPSKKC